MITRGVSCSCGAQNTLDENVNEPMPPAQTPLPVLEEDRLCWSCGKSLLGIAIVTIPVFNPFEPQPAIEEE